jgi:fumarate hydratase class II
MHISALYELDRAVLPALKELHAALKEKADQWTNIIKIGRTHLQVRTHPFLRCFI